MPRTTWNSTVATVALVVLNVMIASSAGAVIVARHGRSSPPAAAPSPSHDVEVTPEPSLTPPPPSLTPAPTAPPEPTLTATPQITAAPKKAAACPAWTAVPKAGTYHYDYTIEETGEPDDSGVEAVRILDSSSGPCVRRQVYTDDGAGSKIDVVWTADGLVIERLDGCTFDPPMVDLKAPLKVGASWTSTGSCSETFEGETFTMTVSDQAKVTKYHAAAKVAAGTAPAFEIHRTIEATLSDGTESESFTSHDVELFSPDWGLTLSYSERIDEPGPPPYTYTSYRELRSFQSS